jgi:hypothetical protein
MKPVGNWIKVSGKISQNKKTSPFTTFLYHQFAIAHQIRQERNMTDIATKSRELSDFERGMIVGLRHARLDLPSDYQRCQWQTQYGPGCIQKADGL